MELTQIFMFFSYVSEVDRCLLTVVGYLDESAYKSAKYVSQILGSLKDFILYRRVQSTSLLDITLPHSKPEKTLPPLSSSDETNARSAGNRLFLRFRSLVESPTFGAERVQSAKRQLVRSASILRHRYLPFSDASKLSSQSVLSHKTASLDRSMSHDVRKRTAAGQLRPRSQSFTDEATDVTTLPNNAISENTQDSNENNNNENNVLKAESVITIVEGSEKEPGKTEAENNKVAEDSGEQSDLSETSDRVRDMGKILDEDFSFEQKFESEDIVESLGSKGMYGQFKTVQYSFSPKAK